MRATFLCLFALQLAFAVMAMPRARAQDAPAEGGEEPTTSGGEEAGTEPTDGGDGAATEPPAEAVRDAQGGEEPTTPAAGGGEEAGTEPADGGDGAATEPPAEAVRDAKDKKKGLCKLSSCTNETTCVPNPAFDDYECVAKGGEEPTKPAADGGEEEGTEPADGGTEGGDGAATEPPAEAVRDAQAPGLCNDFHCGTRRPPGGDGAATEPPAEAVRDAQGGEEPTTPAAGGGEEAGTEPADGGDGAATEPPAEAVRDAQAKYAMRAINEAERNMAKDRNVAKQKLAEIGSAFDQEFDEKTNSRNSYRL